MSTDLTPEREQEIRERMQRFDAFIDQQAAQAGVTSAPGKLVFANGYLQGQVTELQARIAELEQRAAADTALRDAADRIERRAQHLGGEWLRADQIVTYLRRRADTEAGGS
ncbi:hypothetical protein [Streptomyces sp. NPDC058045]|uniref:hypothetical protein n=1 Tax=Streptomyces sp. NPDC058045 TaxID=3346311 RepID=UPI0036E08113